LPTKPSTPPRPRAAAARPRTPKAPSAAPATYAAAGVDIASGDQTKQSIKTLARETFTRGVLSEIGGFGGLFRLSTKKYKDPVLVSSADGVGTKLKVAFQLGVHTTVGQDLVNHCVNDIAVQGATPLFFLDYLATGRLEPSVIEDVVRGLAAACKSNSCALIGGETAQMPGFYADGEYDLAGFIVGAVDRRDLLTGASIRPGDVLLGFPSTGLHTNGYSLARQLLFERAGYEADQHVEALGTTVAEALMAPHRSYLRLIQKLAPVARGFAHITGGGITENLPRIFPEGIGATVELGSWPVPPLFEHLQQLGSVAQDEMLRTFNMGVGLIAVIAEKKLHRVDKILSKLEEPFFILGRTTAGERVITYA
jgi:phosphoribosylformylglycinamidine cyclo-ligase